MPQFNNLAYNALQLQSNNLSNGFIEPNRNLNNHTNTFFSFSSTNSVNNRIVCNSANSPSTILTPGRKSASPTFFHSNDSIYTRNYNVLGNFYHSVQSNKHQNFDCSQNQFLFTNFNGPQLALSTNDSALKIPTTPTRSKSLSPSHRCVNQPARLRHKQQNKNSNLELDQVTNIDNPKIRKDDKKNLTNNENFLFQPIDNIKTKNQRSPQKLTHSTFLDKKQSSDNKRPKLVESNERIQIKKPIPVVPTSQKNDDAQKNSLISIDKNILEKKSTEKDNFKLQNDTQINNSTEKINKKFKLPFNVRMMNLKNYPPNISSIAKRQFSIIMQRVKSENVNTSDQCIQILKQNIQFIFNQEIKQLVDQFKKSFIDPAVKNFNQNKSDTQISDSDMFVFILNLIEDAKKNIIDSGDQNSESTLTSIDPIKRKLDSESDPDLTGMDASDESVHKKPKIIPNETDLNFEEKRDKREIVFSPETKFVLGKSVNDVFLQIQHQLYEVNSDDSNSSANQNDSINPKSIYSRFPNLFRYGADQQDRQWLSENQIIKRKNIKCNILLLDDINELFKNFLKFNCDHNRQESNILQNERDLILKKLKTFSLPEFILNKFKKNYNIQNSKFV